MRSIFCAPNDSESSADSQDDISLEASHVSNENVVDDTKPNFETAGGESSEQPGKEFLSLNQKSISLSRLSSAVNTQLLSLPIDQQMSLLLLAFMEERCMTKACDDLNTKRLPEEQLPIDHPDVTALAARYYSRISNKVVDSTALPDAVTGVGGSIVRDAFRSGFDGILSKEAEKEQNNAESSGTSLTPADVVESIESVLSNTKYPPFASESAYRDEYREISLLGKGAYGNVYKVQSVLDGQLYAVKKITISATRLQKSREKNPIDGVLAELRTLAKLSHQNVVRYFHGWIESSSPVPTATTLIAEEEYSTNLRILPEPKTIENSSDGDVIDGLDVKTLSQHVVSENPEALLQASKKILDKSICDKDDVIFGISSVEVSHEAVQDQERQRRESNATTSSNFMASILTVAEEDPEVENIPRDLDDTGILQAKAETAVLPGLPADFTHSKYLGPDITLYIKMSLHPITLDRYLSFQIHEPEERIKTRHCFHQEPSVGLLSAILDGVEYLHQQKIIHRDLKPANILLSVHENQAMYSAGFVEVSACEDCGYAHSEKRVYITPCISDFGLVAEIEDPVLGSQSNCLTSGVLGPLSPATQPAKPVGTMFYRPMNMPKTEPTVCTKMDVYSLGIIAMEMVHKFSTKSERVFVLLNLKRGILPAEFASHAMANGIMAMACEERDQRWDCANVRRWLGELEGKGKGKSV